MNANVAAQPEGLMGWVLGNRRNGVQEHSLPRKKNAG